MRASLLFLSLLAGCSGGETVGGLSRDEAERLNQAAEMLDQREARFEDREVDETGYGGEAETEAAVVEEE